MAVLEREHLTMDGMKGVALRGDWEYEKDCCRNMLESLPVKTKWTKTRLSSASTLSVKCNRRYCRTSDRCLFIIRVYEFWKDLSEHKGVDYYKNLGVRTHLKKSDISVVMISETLSMIFPVTTLESHDQPSYA